MELLVLFQGGLSQSRNTKHNLNYVSFENLKSWPPLRLIDSEVNEPK